MAPRVARVAEVAHAGVEAGLDPVLEALEPGRVLGRRHAEAREAFAERLLAQDPGGDETVRCGGGHAIDASRRRSVRRRPRGTC